MIIVFLLIALVSISPKVYAQDISYPKLSLVKNVVPLSEPISINYDGVPTALEAKLEDSKHNSIAFKAVLEKNNLLVEPLQNVNDDTYHLVLGVKNHTLLDSRVVWGSIKEQRIKRHTETFVQPNGSYEVDLTYETPSDDMEMLIDKVPYNAIIESTDAAQLKNLSDLNLRFPFNGTYPVSLPFGQVDPAIHFGIGFHDGVDFAIEEKTPIIAVDDGEVVPYREQNQYGITVALQHAWGQTFYGHLSTTSAVLGQKVHKGDVIGLSGNTGLSSGPHLHFGMKVDGDFINALPLLSAENNGKIAQKRVVWTISGKKGDTIHKHFRYTLPDVYKGYGLMYIGPAQVIDSEQNVIRAEPSAWKLIVTDNPGSIHALIQDPNVDQNTSILIKDNVLLWMNDDKRAIHGYDTQTDTKFDVPFIADEPNTLMIGSSEYHASIENNTLVLK